MVKKCCLIFVFIFLTKQTCAQAYDCGEIETKIDVALYAVKLAEEDSKDFFHKSALNKNRKEKLSLKKQSEERKQDYFQFLSEAADWVAIFESNCKK